MYFPDNPTAVSPDFLKKIDQDPPGTWIAQPKFDGWRRCAWRIDGKWVWSSKKGSAGADVAMPKKLVEEFESIRMPSDWDIARLAGHPVLGIDMEWIGPRMVDKVKEDKLIIFDLFMDTQFWHRRELAYRFLFSQPWESEPVKNIEDCPRWVNPGLFDRFQEQMTNPLSEGLVVRRADSRHLMGRNGCLVNPHVLKVKYRNIREIKHERS